MPLVDEEYSNISCTRQEERRVSYFLLLYRYGDRWEIIDTPSKTERKAKNPFIIVIFDYFNVFTVEVQCLFGPFQSTRAEENVQVLKRTWTQSLKLDQLISFRVNDSRPCVLSLYFANRWEWKVEMRSASTGRRNNRTPLIHRKKFSKRREKSHWNDACQSNSFSNFTYLFPYSVSFKTNYHWSELRLLQSKPWIIYWRISDVAVIRLGKVFQYGLCYLTMWSLVVRLTEGSRQLPSPEQLLSPYLSSSRTSETSPPKILKSCNLDTWQKP